MKPITECPDESEPPAVFAVFGGRVLLGQERANIDVLSALREAGCDVTVIMRDESGPEATAFRDKFEALGFTVVQQPFADPILLRGSWSSIWKTIAGLFLPSFTLRTLTARRNRPVVYLFNTYYALTILLYLLLFRTPVIYRAGELLATHNGFRRLLWRLVRRRIVRAVAVSEYIKREFVAHGLSKEKITVIYSRPRPLAPEQPVSACAPHADLPTVVYVGQITKEKGVGLLVEAFERLSEDLACRLVVIGQIDTNWVGDVFARELRDRLRRSGLADYVEFPGFVDDVYKYLRTARVHVQASLLEEGLANTVLEAKLAGVPSVISASGGLPEVVRDGVDGTICKETTAAALADALRPYLEDADLAQRRGEAARASLASLGSERFEANWLAVVRDATS